MHRDSLTRPATFIRNREFPGQEGHSAFATQADAGKDILEVLELYTKLYEEHLAAVPVIKGMKSEHEKSAGALYKTSVEAFIFL